MKRILFALSVVIAGLYIMGCESKLTDAQKIVEKAIETAGGEKYLNSTIAFDFRERHYIATRNGGQYSYERITQDSSGTIHDFVANEGYHREVNGVKVEVPDSMAVRYTSSTNSVIYFALLPYGLNDAAVNKKLLGETTIKEKPYYLVQITFHPDGGGEDFEDVYLYWIHQKDFTVDYLAYSFAEADETSFRFREAYNPRTVNGIRFQDYINYSPADNSIPLDSAESFFKKGKLEELSRIETENPTVR